MIPQQVTHDNPFLNVFSEHFSLPKFFLIFSSFQDLELSIQFDILHLEDDDATPGGLRHTVVGQVLPCHLSRVHHRTKSIECARIFAHHPLGRVQ